MIEIAYFMGAMIGSLLDPIVLAVCLLCGIFVSNRWGAAGIAVAIRVILCVITSLTPPQFIASILATFLVTLLIHWITSRVKKREA